MMKDESEKEIESFFAQLKEQDKAVQIPDFPQAKSSRRLHWWLPVGIAAALAVGFWLGRSEPVKTELESDLVIIRLVEDENQGQQIIIEKTSNIDVWESPTSSLLTEY
jgi:hypothetical protein